MKALTIWQPWASLIILGFKPYEFRGWKAPGSIVGQRIAIHAGMRKPKVSEIQQLRRQLFEDQLSVGIQYTAIPVLEKWIKEPDTLWLGAVLGTAVLGPTKTAAEIATEFKSGVNDSDRHEHANFAWPMLDIETFEPPVPARGAQGFWNWKEKPNAA